MQHSFYHKLSGVLWGIIVTLVVLLAFYVSLGRLLTASVSQFETEILQQLNARLPFKVEARAVSGRWQSFSPQLVLSHLRLSIPGVEEGLPLELAEGRLTLDVLDSLLSRSLQVSQLHLHQLQLQAELTSEGKLRLVGIEGRGFLQSWLQQFLLNMERLDVSQVSVELALPDGTERQLDLSLELWRDGGQRQLRATMESPKGTEVLALGKGVGNPFSPDSFTGELYLHTKVADMQTLQAAIVADPGVRVSDGALDLELWFAWDRGVPRFDGRVESRDLVLAATDGDWQMPVQQLSFNAALVQHRQRWTLFASDLLMRRNGNRLQLPRLQFDAWGDSLRLRSQDVSIAQLNLALVDLEFTPDKLEQALRILQPGGSLSTLELFVSDYKEALREWHLEANFSELELDSWRGAPGAAGGEGYLELGQNGGFALVDARDVSLEFPKVYREPLHYQDLFGTVYIDLHPDAIVLSSGIITGLGPEGVVKALFGLNIPLQPSELGPEMDLMAGFEQVSADHRSKYLPYILKDPLENWLGQAIEGGEIRAGGFIWRGSLKKGLGEARTVQLFLDLTDTSLNYHPDWPQVSELEGLVLVDDANVSIWTEHARVYDTQLKVFSAETWINDARQMVLQLDTSARGFAEDGMRVLRESPLNELTRGVFSDWRFRGDMDVSLNLQLYLAGEAAPAKVHFEARPRGAELQIEPGELLLTDIEGQFEYSSDSGFSGRHLSGKLWGEQIEVKLWQQHPPGQAYQASTSAVALSFETEVEMANIQRWLKLDVLSHMQGRSRALVGILAPPGESPRVSISSDLQGVALDLPDPWSRSEEQLSALALEVELSTRGALVSLDLEGKIAVQLDVSEGSLRGASLGFMQPPPGLEQGAVRVGGTLPQADAEQWLDFIESSFAPGLRDSGQPSGESLPVAAGLDPIPPQARPAPQIRIEELQVQQLNLWGRSVDDLRFSLSQHPDHWQLVARTDWLRGNFELAQGARISRLELDYLDLDRLPVAELAGETDSDLKLPDMDVLARGLHRGDRLLGELAFSLRNSAGGVEASGISGELAELEFRDSDDNRLRWQAGPEPESWLQARVHFKDLGATLEDVGYQRILETSGGEFGFDLRWPDGPTDFELAEAEGNIDIAVGAGRFPDTPAAATGALQVVRILNLAEIVSRLSMTHMFESGIPFSKVNGEITLDKGVLRVPSLDVLGASSRFLFTGESTVREQSLEGELVATLPVANNLPWVAALAAGLPIAAGVFVVSKVFEDQVNKLSSAIYDISGTWDDPQVKFSRIFNVEAQSRAAASKARQASEGDTPARAER